MLFKLRNILLHPKSEIVWLLGLVAAIIGFYSSFLSTGHYVLSALSGAAAMVCLKCFFITKRESKQIRLLSYDVYRRVKNIKHTLLTFRTHVQTKPDLVLEYNNVVLGKAETKLDKILETFYNGLHDPNVVWYIDALFQKSEHEVLLKKINEINRHESLLEAFKATTESIQLQWLKPLKTEAQTIDQLLKSEDMMLDTVLSLHNLTKTKRTELEQRLNEKTQAEAKLSDIMK